MLKYTEEFLLFLSPKPTIFPRASISIFFWFLKYPVDLYRFALEYLTYFHCFHCSVPFFNHSALHLVVHSVLVHKTFNSCIVFYNWFNESPGIDTWCFLFIFFILHIVLKWMYLFIHLWTVYRIIANSLISGQIYVD